MSVGNGSVNANRRKLMAKPYYVQWSGPVSQGTAIVMERNKVLAERAVLDHPEVTKVQVINSWPGYKDGLFAFTTENQL